MISNLVAQAITPYELNIHLVRQMYNISKYRENAFHV